MTKAYFTGSCGHRGHVIARSAHAAERWAATKEGKDLCPSCWGKDQAVQRAAAIADRKEAVKGMIEEQKSMNLPGITGTPKQVNWAQYIRAEKISQYMKAKRAAEGKAAALRSEGHIEMAEKIELSIFEMERHFETLLSINIAATWIHYRDTHVKDILMYAARLGKLSHI